MQVDLSLAQRIPDTQAQRLKVIHCLSSFILRALLPQGLTAHTLRKQEDFTDRIAILTLMLNHSSAPCCVPLVFADTLLPLTTTTQKDYAKYAQHMHSVVGDGKDIQKSE